MQERFSDDAFAKKVFYFTNSDRTSLDGIEIGAIASISVKDGKNRIIVISFIVTRDAHLGKNSRWVYGKVLGSPNGEYYQIELRLNKNRPEADAIAVFLQAPPNIIQ